MAVSNIVTVADQVKTDWSPIFTKELRESSLLINLLDKSQGAQWSPGGDTVKVNQIDAPEGQLLTVGTDNDTFDSEEIATQQVDIKVNKVAIASYEFTSEAQMLSLLGSQEDEIRSALMYAVGKKINAYLYSLMVPSASAPDHQLTTADFNAATVATGRLTAAKAKWPESLPWYMVLDPSFFSDALDDQTLASSDYGAADAPVIGGKMARPRFGFNIFEDNSLATDTGYAFYKDCVHLVIAKDMDIKISDLHAQKKRGMLMSAEVVFGAAEGIDGDEKMIKWTVS